MKPLRVPPTFPIENNQFQSNDLYRPTGLARIIAAEPMKVG